MWWAHYHYFWGSVKHIWRIVPARAKHNIESRNLGWWKHFLIFQEVKTWLLLMTRLSNPTVNHFQSLKLKFYYFNNPNYLLLPTNGSDHVQLVCLGKHISISSVISQHKISWLFTIPVILFGTDSWFLLCVEQGNMVSGECFSRSECKRCIAFFPINTLSRSTQLLTAGHQLHICTVLEILEI